MNDNLQAAYGGYIGSVPSAEQRNRVLRNTYWMLALSMVPPDVADDVVAEAFARVLAAIRAGGGPDHAFRPYLLAAVRNLANDWIAARRRVTVIGDMDEEPGDRSAPLTSGFSRDAASEAGVVLTFVASVGPGLFLRTVLTTPALKPIMCHATPC